MASVCNRNRRVFSEIPPEQSLTLAYRDVIDAPETAAAAIGHFLELPH